MTSLFRKTLSLSVSTISLAMLLLGCNAPEAALEATPTPSPMPITSSATVPTPEPAAKEPQLSAWTVYWDTEQINDELTLLAPELKSISVFSTLFDKDDTLYVPDQTAELLSSVKEQFGATKDIYLTFVNDIARKNGSFSLKDVELLERLFASEERMDAHISEMIALAKEYDCDGIELDYEAMRKKSALWEPFAVFVERLYHATQDAGLLCRVVLEPSALGKVKYPEGPDYVLMCYNLHGSHSDPGPKANTLFINAIAAESRDLTGLTFAFSTGGFDWDADDKATQLTEQEAAALAKAQGIVPEREEKSGALHFTYTAEDDSKHTVWYADGETLALWMRTAAKKGVSRFALWRTGGNTAETLQAVMEAAKE